MADNKLTNISWYTDSAAVKKGEPGIVHSFLRSVASALNYLDNHLDPVWLMGASGFAFRIFVNEILCPSAMSMFSFRDLLPETIRQMGHDCYYIQRMWNEKNKEEEKRTEAHKAIVAAIDKDIPAICWDVADAEWGLITGYNDQTQSYTAMRDDGSEISFPYEKLGKNCIEILSVCIPGNPNLRKCKEVIANSLKAAVAHAEGKEWIDDRPKYQNGLEAYNAWTSVFEKWALLVENGKSGKIASDLSGFALYYAGHYYSARCYARDYLAFFSSENEHLHKASLAYAQAADSLKPLWDYFSTPKKPESMKIKSFARKIIVAKSCEEAGIDLIRKYLDETK
jgi:hypothetical protein